MTQANKSLQETFAPDNACFGCGVSNTKGLQIKSYPQDDGAVTATWRAEKHHEAFPGMINGGIIGALLDCHSNWTSAWTLMQHNKAQKPPCTVTAKYAVKLLRPTPSDAELHITANPIHIDGDKVTIEASLSANGKVCATCEGLFVAVTEGHPAFHRW